MAPVLSPSKTWEGLIGGTMTATAWAQACGGSHPSGRFGRQSWRPFSVPVGFLGGLILSAVKRDRGVKDWADWLPGHGGVMDRPG